MAKIGITIDDELLKKLDLYADEMYTSRSGFITFSVRQIIASFEASNHMKDLTIAIKKLADNGQVDDSIIEKIVDFERLAKFVIGDFKTHI